MRMISTIGLGIAKNVFQMHGIDGQSNIISRRQFRRSQVLKYFAKLPPCLFARAMH